VYKLGILLYGEARTYKVAKMYFDQAFPDCKIDYFGHAWNTESSHHIGVYIKHNPKKLQQEIQETYETANIIVTDYDKEFKRLAKPIEKYKSKKNRSQTAEMVVRGARINQWRSFERASRVLKKIKTQYDLIICSRFDIVFQPRPNIIERVLDVIKNCRASIDNNEILVTSGDPAHLGGFNSQHDIVMHDLLWCGTTEGIIKFGHNFTRNRIKQIRTEFEQEKILPTLNDVERKLIERYIACRGYREMWGLQLLESKVSRRVLDKFGKIIIARSGCPDLDLETIKKYTKYYDFFKHKQFLIKEMRHFGGDWRKYNPEFDYGA